MPPVVPFRVMCRDSQRTPEPCAAVPADTRQIVRGADAIAFAVGKLSLYPVGIIAKFIQECGGHGSEAVKGMFARGATDLPQDT